MILLYNITNYTMSSSFKMFIDSNLNDKNTIETVNIVGSSLAATYDIMYFVPNVPVITSVTSTNINWTEVIETGKSLTKYVINIEDTFDNITTNLTPITALSTDLSSLWYPEFGHQYKIIITAYNVFTSTSSEQFNIYYDIYNNHIVIMII